MVAPRLSRSTLPSVPASAQPPIDPADVEVGIAHLGIGAFHRAHQAVYTQAAMAATGDLRWGICGVTQRSRDVVDQLTPQDGLYAVLVRSADGVKAEVNAAVRQVLPGPEAREQTVALLANPRVQVVTLTVTEKGYRHKPASGRLRRDDTAVQADVTAGRASAPTTVVGQLARGLQRRMEADAGPISVMCCDNLPGNGTVVRQVVSDFVDLLPVDEGADLSDWIARHARFPSTMVDRIVPATTDDDRDEVTRLLGVTDAGVVVAEPFTQWVVQSDFAGERPAWERVGVTFTDDVAPYEAMKLRLLNGSHSALAYLGALADHEYLADVVRSGAFVSYVRALMDVDVTPTLAVPSGFDLGRYKQDLFERFGNRALRHRTLQIAMDGSQKLPHRLVAVTRDRRRTGAEPRHAALGLAAWMRFVWTGSSESGRPLPLDDPLATQLRDAVDGATRPSAVVDALLGVHEVFGTDLADDDVVRRLLTESLSTLVDAGAAAAAAEFADGGT